uniref:Uncharacterized protein n=1 Tax=Gossypium raimondii TaxID=29730 RepID=A0A0D2PYA3_GOSRA|nr:hypothetical protein B456_002G143600 [Gossypium raimondii]KJB11980.1 hypothetical protein B456_002G143600 [Gossypium raimondii]
MKERVKTRRFRLASIEGRIWLFTCLIREVVHGKLVLLGINNEDGVDVVNKGCYNENLSQQINIDDRGIAVFWLHVIPAIVMYSSQGPFSCPEKLGSISFSVEFLKLILITLLY